MGLIGWVACEALLSRSHRQWEKLPEIHLSESFDYDSFNEKDWETWLPPELLCSSDISPATAPVLHLTSGTARKIYNLKLAGYHVVKPHILNRLHMINRPVRILIANDHPIFRYGLLKLLETEPLLQVVGQADNGDEAVTMVRLLKPDLVLLDLAMSPLPGLEVLRTISEFSNSTRTILFTASTDKSQVLEALQIGVQGILLKKSATEVLFKCISAVMAGQYWVGRDSMTDLVHYLWDQRPSSNGEARKPNFGLTERELEIVSAIASGCTNRGIAEEFSISEQTVKHHLTNIFDKTGVSNRLELALFAIKHRLPGTLVIAGNSASVAAKSARTG